MPQKGAGGRGAKPRNATPAAPKRRAAPKKTAGRKTKMIGGRMHVQNGAGFWDLVESVGDTFADSWDGIKAAGKRAGAAWKKGSGYKMSGEGFRQSGSGPAGLRHKTPLALPAPMRR
jgi:hypothetical protein